MVDAVYDCRGGFIFSRGRNKDFLCSGIQMRLALLGRSIETSAFKDILDTVISDPRDIRCIFFGINRVFFPFNYEGGIG